MLDPIALVHLRVPGLGNVIGVNLSMLISLERNPLQPLRSARFCIRGVACVPPRVPARASTTALEHMCYSVQEEVIFLNCAASDTRTQNVLLG